MAPDNEVEYVTLVRVLEYYGPRKFVEDTLKASNIPLQGQKEFPVGSYIRSGVIVWDGEGVAKQSMPPIMPIATVPPGRGN